MIKVFGCSLIIIASTIGGFIYAEGFKKRVRQLNELERAIDHLQNEIEYTHTPLPEALASVAEKCEEPVNHIFHNTAKLLNSNCVYSVYEAFEKCFMESSFESNLNKEDMDVILDFSKTLGEADIEGHKKIFSLAKLNLGKRINSAELAMKKNVKMYRYLGFSIGAMIAIVLI